MSTSPHLTPTDPPTIPPSVAPVDPPQSAAASRPQESRRPTWLGPAIGALIAIIIVFGVLDLGQFLAPRPLVGQTHPIIITVHNLGGQGGAQGNLSASPQAITLACSASAPLTLTNQGQRALRWTLAALPSGVTLAANDPRSGFLNTASTITLTVTSIGQPGAKTLTFTTDAGDTLTVPLTITC